MKLRAALGSIAAKRRDVAGAGGMGFIAYGAHEIYHPVGWIVLGLELVAIVALLTAAKARADAAPDVGTSA